MDLSLEGCTDLGQAFERVRAAFPERIALSYPTGEQVSYSELGERVSRVSAGLLQVGAKQGNVVAIFSRKSPDAIATVLACNRLGLLYTHLDGASPAERCIRILDRCAPEVVLVDGEDSAPFAARCGTHAPKLRTIGSLIGSATHTAQVSGITGSDGAYIMFTSGSTGFPKGAVITQANVLTFIAWGRHSIGVTHEDVLTNVNPIHFDNSVFDLYVALYNGATLCPFTAEQVKDARALVKQVDQLGCTIWFSVPSMLVYLLTMRAIDGESFRTMRQVLFGGEGFPKVKLKELHTLIGHRTRLVNVYGPTECTCICSAYSITEKDLNELDALAPLGHLAPGFNFHIDGADANDPHFGELLLGGPNVGAGYYNDPERTTAAFVQDPRTAAYRKMMYRTGDLVRLDHQGLLHFKGRGDNQIKHMGYRIELEEIEAAFNALAEVHEVGVVHKPGAAGAPGSIHAYVHAAEAVTAEDLARRVAEVLPPYMRPRPIFVQHTPLPKNSNGKIDRQALKALAP